MEYTLRNTSLNDKFVEMPLLCVAQKVQNGSTGTFFIFFPKKLRAENQFGISVGVVAYMEVVEHSVAFQLPKIYHNYRLIVLEKPLRDHAHVSSLELASSNCVNTKEIWKLMDTIDRIFAVVIPPDDLQVTDGWLVAVTTMYIMVSYRGDCRWPRSWRELTG